ncbi:DnaJ homolog subfamily B member 12 [Linum perenne]
MECNKDEATRAKEIAEKKFLDKDFLGARKFALKAQNLYPELEGIAQMIASFDVYISSQTRVNGEEDWYGILGVNPLADDDMVRKQYRKLALMLHPDKNKSVGADGAFKLVSMAWSSLSDKTKRVAYDQKRKSNIFWNVAGSANGTTSTKPTSAAGKSKGVPRTGHSSTPASSQKSKPNTFWTVCNQCKMQYEYLRVYLNHNLLCPNCHEPFIATETPPPSSHGYKSTTQWNFSQQSQKPNPHASSKNTTKSSNRSKSSNGGTNFQWTPFSGSGTTSYAARAASVVQQAYEKVKREREEAQAATRRDETLKRKSNATKRTGTGYVGKRRRSMEDGGLNTRSSFNDQMGSPSGRAGDTKLFGFGDGTQVDIQSLLVEKGKIAVSKKLDELNSSTLIEVFVRNGNDIVKEDNKLEKLVANGDSNEPSVPGGSPNPEERLCKTVISPVTSDAKTNSENFDTMFIDVLDPHFHNFDKDRTETCFGENQVWAAYDSGEGFPRHYAKIDNVISLDPLKLRISWLTSKANSNFDPLDWISSSFSKSWGEFQVGRREIYRSLYCFSHKVRWTRGIDGSVHIYPRKGDVWALYRNWSPDWNEITADDVIRKYDVVEVLDDYNEELGVIVVPLVKVAGFKTLFRQHLDVGEIRRIPREEMFRFSHLVPSYMLTGQEGPDCPKGCRELDPAATPVELLHVVIDVRKEDFLENETETEPRVQNNEDNTM